MDRTSVGALLSLALVASGSLASCAGPSPKNVALAPHILATEPSRGHSSVQTASSDSLAYHVAFADPYLVSVELTTEFALVIRNRDDGKLRARRINLGPADFDILDLQTSSDGSRAYVASTAGWVRTYALDEATMLSEWRMGSRATSLALSDDQEYLAIGTDSGVICLRRLRDAAQLQCVRAHPSRVAALDIWEGTLVSGDLDGTITTWSLPGLRETARVGGDGYISDVAFSRGGRRLAIVRNRRPPVRTPELQAQEKSSANVDPPEHNVVELRVTTSLAKAPITLTGHRSLVSSVAWIGTDLISTSWDRSVRVWNTEDPGSVRTLLKLGHLASDVATSPSGGQVAVAGWATKDGSPSLTTLKLLYARP